MMIKKPTSLYDRDHEWEDLITFVTAAGQGLRIGVVHGRRRQGKSFLLRRLVQACGGLYVACLEEERIPALQRFADQIGESLLDLPAGTLHFDSWEQAFRTAISRLNSAQKSNVPPVLVIDELPYLLVHSPEIPSILQNLYDESRDDREAPAVRLILCGSALSVMNDLLSGTKALRGRATLDMCLQPFNFRKSKDFWHFRDSELAFQVHAVLGGTPGYRSLIEVPPPTDVTKLGEWFAGNILNPSHALFTESEYLLSEDPRITNRALYFSLLTAVSSGARIPTQIGAAIGRPATALAHPLGVLQKAGFLRKVPDVLRERRGVLAVADPIVRFQQLIAIPRRASLEEKRAAQVWKAAQTTFHSNILGPHFEEMARMWTVQFSQELLGFRVGEVGSTVVNDSAGRSQHELDVVALAEGEALHNRGATVTLLGEAKASQRPRTRSDLTRLEHIRSLLTAQGTPAADAYLALFARNGVDAELAAEAKKRSDVLIIDLPQLYGLKRKRSK